MTPQDALGAQGRPPGSGRRDERTGQAGQRLRELRQRAGITQAELGRRTGLFRQTLCHWENGIHEPLLGGIRAVAEALSTPRMPAPQVAEYLLWGTGRLARK